MVYIKFNCVLHHTYDDKRAFKGFYLNVCKYTLNWGIFCVRLLCYCVPTLMTVCNTYNALLMILSFYFVNLQLHFLK